MRHRHRSCRQLPSSFQRLAYPVESATGHPRPGISLRPDQEESTRIEGHSRRKRRTEATTPAPKPIPALTRRSASWGQHAWMEMSSLAQARRGAQGVDRRAARIVQGYPSGCVGMKARGACSRIGSREPQARRRAQVRPVNEAPRRLNRTLRWGVEQPPDGAHTKGPGTTTTGVARDSCLRRAQPSLQPWPCR